MSVCFCSHEICRGVNDILSGRLDPWFHDCRDHVLQNALSDQGSNGRFPWAAKPP